MDIKNFFATAKNEKINSLRSCTNKESILEFAKNNNISVSTEDVEKLLFVLKRQVNDASLDSILGGSQVNFKEQPAGCFGYCKNKNMYIFTDPSESNCEFWDDGNSIFSWPDHDKEDSKPYNRCISCVYFSQIT